MNKYSASPHSTYNVGYHIVFCTKYRYSLLRYRAAERLKTLLNQSAEVLGITIQTIEVMPDHVHLFVVARPRAIPRTACERNSHTCGDIRHCGHGPT